MKYLINYHNKEVYLKYAEDRSVSESYAATLLKETKKYLYCCSICDFPLSPSFEIEKMWCQFILFTKDYRVFCNEFLGKFIDYYPAVLENTATDEIKNHQLGLARCLAIENFGAIHAEIWS